jgi:hypothetical protein
MLFDIFEGEIYAFMVAGVKDDGIENGIENESTDRNLIISVCR